MPPSLLPHPLSPARPHRPPSCLPSILFPEAARHRFSLPLLARTHSLAGARQTECPTPPKNWEWFLHEGQQWGDGGRVSVLCSVMRVINKRMLLAVICVELCMGEPENKRRGMRLSSRQAVSKVRP